MIELREVSKAYRTGAGPVHALNKLDLKIESGEFLSIMGQSGSGKSTLMNILGCLDRPTEGQYILGDLDVANLSDKSRSALRGRWFGFIFQNYNLLPRLSALEQVELPLLYNKVSNRRRRASEKLDHFENRNFKGSFGTMGKVPKRHQNVDQGSECCEYEGGRVRKGPSPTVLQRIFPTIARLWEVRGVWRAKGSVGRGWSAMASWDRVCSGRLKERSDRGRRSGRSSSG